MARGLNRGLAMRCALVILCLVLGACRGEPVPRDHQNIPEVNSAAGSKGETPAGHGMGQATPETSTGGEGMTPTDAPVAPPTSTGAPTTTISDTPPITTTKAP